MSSILINSDGKEKNTLCDTGGKMKIVIDVEMLYKESGSAKLSELAQYESGAIKLAGNGNDLVITGKGPIWLYLKLSHALHGKCRSLCYDSPVTGEVIIYDHNPW